MSGIDDESAGDPLHQDDLGTLEAELREALQHQRAAVERVRETQAAVEELLVRARKLLGRGSGQADRP